MIGEKRINGFVLAGGKSRRMGRDKALMRVGTQPLVLRAAGILEPFVNEVALIAPPGRYKNLGLHVVPDMWPGQGPLAAICTGLLSSSAEWNMFLACDLPLISRHYMQYMVERVRTAHSDAIVPRTQGTWQPLSAAYHARCGTAFLRAIEEGHRSVIGAFDQVRVEIITEDEMVNAGLSEMELINVNTPEDWERVKELLKGAR